MTSHLGLKFNTLKLYINLVEIEIMKDVAKQTRTLPTAIETDFNRWVGGHLDVDREIFDEFLKKRQQGSQHKYQGRHHASEYLINRIKVTSLFKILGISIPNTVLFPSLITIHPKPFFLFLLPCWYRH